MHRCSNGQGNILGPCTCGLFHSQTNPFSMLFSMSTHKPFDETDVYYSNFTSSSPSVDCTLSLGTPSTRSSNEDHHEKPPRHERRPSSCMSNFRWDALQSKHNNTPSSTHKTGRGGGNGNSNNAYTVSDPLVARRCANCDTTSTPLWRNGPRGPKSLCNACGIRFKKEERRASAAASSTTTTNSAAAGGIMEAQQMMSQHNNPWAVHHSQSQKMPCHSPGNDQFRFIEDHDSADTGIPFLSWRLNVTDRPSLIHDFTR